jgi:transmembrane sensor
MTELGIDKNKLEQFFNNHQSDINDSYVNDIFCDKSKEDELNFILIKQFESLSSEGDRDDAMLNTILSRIHSNSIDKQVGAEKGFFDRIIKWSYRIAGIFVLPIIIFIGIQLFRNTSIEKATWVELKAPAWSRIQFSLPDGTTGWLNSNSSIKYNGNFISDRQITLNGEAFFEVFKSSDRPFVVITNHLIAEVHGTRFNIAAYDNEKNEEIVLERGELTINNISKTKFYKLKPNDLLIYDKNSDGFSTEMVLPYKYLSWTDGKLVFRNDPLDVIARRLERWYNIDVEVKDFSDTGLRLRGTFDSESLEELLSLLKRSLPIDYQIVDRKLNIDDTYSKKKVIISLKPKTIFRN